MDDDLERIKERKRERLAEERAGPGDAGGDDAGGTAETPGEPVPVEGEDHFAELVATNRVVLADFYADWCGPCRMLEPIVEDVAAESDAAVMKVDVDAHQGLAAEYGVRGVPTLVLFADGEPVEQVVGVREKNQLLGLVEEYAS